MSTNNTSRQYLRFLSKLYELAANFDQRELNVFASEAKLRGDRAATQIAESLARLASVSSGRDHVAPDVEKDGLLFREQALREVLLSREIFPSKQDIVSVLGGRSKISFDSKESRERVVSRVMAQIRSMPESERTALVGLVERLVADKGSSAFVGKWSKLIRNL